MSFAFTMARVSPLETARERKTALIVFGMLVILYSFIFILLTLNDYAYLAGNIGLFMLLAVIMRLSGKLELFKKVTLFETADKKDDLDQIE